MTSTVTLTPDLEEIVNQQIATGQYATREEVIAASLHLLRDTDARKEAELRALLDEAEEDVRAGRVAPFDPLATAARVKAARAARAAYKP
jgi:putative addiction module CopG family antidote